jgi:hypothetical protein
MNIKNSRLMSKLETGYLELRQEAETQSHMPKECQSKMVSCCQAKLGLKKMF